MRAVSLLVVAILITWAVGFVAGSTLGSPEGYLVEFVVGLILGAGAGVLSVK